MKVWNHEYTKEYELLDMCGSGGEGSVYLVEGQPDLIAKIYTKESLERRYPDASGQYTWTMQEKVAHMASVAPSLPLRVDEGGDEVLAVAWPQVPLFDADNQFVGFLMPRVATSSADSLVPDLHVAYRERERKYLFGESYTWLTAIRLAKNLSTVVRELHEHDVVVGDFNCNNILIDRDAHVMLIDADSFCVRNDLRGITYKCVVGVGEFLAPELQGVNFAEGRSRRIFTKESDCFALAIHIFMLLMNGTHPFSGDKVGTTKRSSSSTEPYVTAIAQGRCPYVTGSRLASFANTPNVHALPIFMRQMFDRAFGYASEEQSITEESIGRRPTATEWETALGDLLDACKASSMCCPIDETHINPPSTETCIWCELNGQLTPLEPRQSECAADHHDRHDENRQHTDEDEHQDKTEDIGAEDGEYEYLDDDAYLDAEPIFVGSDAHSERFFDRIRIHPDEYADFDGKILSDDEYYDGEYDADGDYDAFEGMRPVPRILKILALLILAFMMGLCILVVIDSTLSLGMMSSLLP